MAEGDALMLTSDLCTNAHMHARTHTHTHRVRERDRDTEGGKKGERERDTISQVGRV